MNPNYSEFKFPIIKANQWSKVFEGSKRPMTKSYYDGTHLIGELLKYDPDSRLKPLEALKHPFFDQLRQDPGLKLPNGSSLPKDLFNFTEEEISSTTPEIMKLLQPHDKSADK